MLARVKDWAGTGVRGCRGSRGWTLGELPVAEPARQLGGMRLRHLARNPTCKATPIKQSKRRPASHHIVQDHQTVSLCCLQEDFNPPSSIRCKLQEEFSLVTAVRDMPDLPRQVVSLCSGHPRLSISLSFTIKNADIPPVLTSFSRLLQVIVASCLGPTPFPFSTRARPAARAVQSAAGGNSNWPVLATKTHRVTSRAMICLRTPRVEPNV
jgi:hypothetical protein